VIPGGTHTPGGFNPDALADICAHQVYVDNSDLILRNMVFKQGPSKTVYEFGEKFSKAGIKVTAIYSDDSEKEMDGAACSVDGYDRAKRGAQKVTLKVNKFSHTVDVTVKVPANA
jgi:hypothetical protein